MVSNAAEATSFGARVIVGTGRPPRAAPAPAPVESRGDATAPFAAVAAEADPELEPHAVVAAIAAITARRWDLENVLAITALTVRRIAAPALQLRWVERESDGRVPAPALPWPDTRRRWRALRRILRSGERAARRKPRAACSTRARNEARQAGTLRSPRWSSVDGHRTPSRRAEARRVREPLRARPSLAPAAIEARRCGVAPAQRRGSTGLCIHRRSGSAESHRSSGRRTSHHFDTHRPSSGRRRTRRPRVPCGRARRNREAGTPGSQC